MKKRLKKKYKSLKNRWNPRLPSHLRKSMSVEGHVSAAECGLLFDLARKVEEGCIIETGSYRGRSTIALALGSRSGGGAPVYAFEPHEVYAGLYCDKDYGPADRVAFFKNLLREGCVETVRLVNLSSEVVAPGWNRPVGLAWLDGDHRYEGVKRDFECWDPHLIPGGLMAFHDSLKEEGGPYRVIREILATGDYDEVTCVGLTAVLQKK